MDRCPMCDDRGLVISTVYGSQYLTDGDLNVEYCGECLRLNEDRDATNILLMAIRKLVDSGKLDDDIKEARRVYVMNGHKC